LDLTYFEDDIVTIFPKTFLHSENWAGSFYWADVNREKQPELLGHIAVFLQREEIQTITITRQISDFHKK
jgi:hypothetical protein